MADFLRFVFNYWCFDWSKEVTTPQPITPASKDLNDFGLVSITDYEISKSTSYEMRRKSKMLHIIALLWLIAINFVTGWLKVIFIAMFIENIIHSVYFTIKAVKEHKIHEQNSI